VTACHNLAHRQSRTILPRVYTPKSVEAYGGIYPSHLGVRGAESQSIHIIDHRKVNQYKENIAGFV